ncbi:MAG: efflux transporter periplasmic adaptor subunit [Phycisphaerae bacterium]|nr:efflux transporter periplasmic adaptor subunit [Phycisphaerae bacterium]
MSKKKIYLIVSIAVVLIAAFMGGMTLKETKHSDSEMPVFTAKRGPLTISFVESGTIKAREQIIIKNEVEGRTSIISLIPEGSRVKKGDLLVELDASGLEDQKLDQEINVQNNEASYIGAKENLAVVENQAKSDVDLATLKFEFAKQDLEKYIQGEYPYELDKADAEIQLANEELARAEETLKWSRQLAEEKYLSKTELQADEIAEKKRTLDVELAEKSKELLIEYTYKRNIAQLESDVSQTQMALERTERKAKADVIQAQAELKAKEAEFQRQKDKLKKLEDQLGKTKVYAPADGLVIYATSAQTGGFRGNTEPLDEGQEVRERQELIYLPVGSESKAEISIHESNLQKTRVGLPAIITIDAMQGKTLYGRISQIAPLPNAQSMWMNPDLKVYNSEVYIDGNDDSLRTGMGCQAEVIIQRYSDTLYIPLQAVIRVGSEPTVYVKNGNSFEPRAVKTGLDNNKMIQIEEGLKEGDIVLLSPPLKSAAVETKNYDGLPQILSDEPPQQKITEDSQTQKIETPAQADDTQGQDRRKQFENMTAEQREEMRKKFEQMSPEEKEKLKQQFGGGGRRRSNGDNQQPATSDR